MSHAPTLPGLFSPDVIALPQGRTKGVQATSVEAYQSRLRSLEGRANVVLMQLQTCQVFIGSGPVTSGELAYWMEQNGQKPELSWDARLIYIRRGLSDLKRKGIVENVTGGVRVCRVMDSKQLVWRVKSR